MLCEKCGKNPATTYFRQAINGKVTEYRLCDECASRMSGSTMFGDIDLGYFLGNMFKISDDYPTSDENIVHCDGCGLTYNEIAKRGKMGCARCYEVFKDKLRPSIESIHGRTVHVGKVPLSLKRQASLPKDNDAENRNQEVERLKQDLQKAIDHQEFERAAVLRDQLKGLEGQGN